MRNRKRPLKQTLVHGALGLGTWTLWEKQGLRGGIIVNGILESPVL